MKRGNARKKYNVKSSLMILMLLAVFLIISTYAWFTSNKLVKITDIDVHIQASEGFQISLDGVNWRSVINADEITGTSVNANYMENVNHLSSTMDPVSTATTRNAEGFMNMFLGAVTTNEQGEYVMSATEIQEKKDTGGFIAFDLFFRTNNEIVLCIDEEAGVIDLNHPDMTGAIATRANKGMENAARVGFVYQGIVPATTAGKPAELGAEARLLKQDKDATGTKVTIWEPNYLEHTEATRVDMSNLFGMDPTETDTKWTNRQIYDGVFADIDSLDPVLLAENNATDEPDYFSPILAQKFVSTPKTYSGSKSLNIILQPGITKYRIYMWLEGQDWDCYDSASGSDIRWQLVLTAIKEPAVLLAAIENEVAIAYASEDAYTTTSFDEFDTLAQAADAMPETTPEEIADKVAAYKLALKELVLEVPTPPTP